MLRGARGGYQGHDRHAHRGAGGEGVRLCGGHGELESTQEVWDARHHTDRGEDTGWGGHTYRAFGHLVGGLWYEITGRLTEAVPNERVVQTTDGRVMKTLLSGATALSMRPEGSGTHLTVEYSPPTIEKIPVLGSILGGLIEKEMVRAGEPMWAELRELLEGTEAA